MNVVMAANDTVYCGLELVIYSTLTHNKNINWYILTMDIGLPNGQAFRGIDEAQKNKLRKIVQYLDQNSNITFVDCAQYHKDFLAGGANEFSGFTPYAALRLIMDKALPYINDALYFDCDVAVRGNFETMYYDCCNHKENCAYAVYAEEAEHHEGEMVSGVMFFNLDVTRKTGFFDRAIYNFKAREYRYPDQMAMRDAGAIARLSPIYGYMWDYQKNNTNPIILHFTNQLTPKIYMARNEDNEQWFYKVFPEFVYVRTGLRLIDTIVGL